MKRILFLTLFSVVGLAGNGYRGEFSQTNVSGPECDELFAVKKYDTQLLLTGSAGTTAVLHFTDPTALGFFHNLNLLGNNGGFGDILVRKEFVTNGKSYKIQGEGLFDNKFLYLEMKAEVSANNKLLCTGTAEYSGF